MGTSGSVDDGFQPVLSTKGRDSLLSSDKMKCSVVKILC